jgi:hypothetical protein
MGIAFDVTVFLCMGLSRWQYRACFIDFTHMLQWLFTAQSRDG